MATEMTDKVSALDILEQDPELHDYLVRRFYVASAQVRRRPVMTDCYRKYWCKSRLAHGSIVVAWLVALIGPCL